MMKYFIKLYPVFFIICIFFSSSSFAERLLKKDDKNIPIEITSEKMVSSKKSNKITFIGDVVAIRGNLTILSDEMTVYNKKSGKTEKIVAKGHVKIEREGKVALGDHAVYFEKEGKIVLTGNPRAWEKDNEIIGKEMIFLLNEDKFIVKGSKEKKMKLTFYPAENNKKN